MPDEPMLQFFKWEHLPEDLAIVSKPFGFLAEFIVSSLPRNPERTTALRKLLEAKDCAVRAKLYKGWEAKWATDPEYTRLPSDAEFLREREAQPMRADWVELYRAHLVGAHGHIRSGVNGLMGVDLVAMHERIHADGWVHDPANLSETGRD